MRILCYINNTTLYNLHSKIIQKEMESFIKKEKKLIDNFLNIDFIFMKKDLLEYLLSVRNYKKIYYFIDIDKCIEKDLLPMEEKTNIVNIMGLLKHSEQKQEIKIIFFSKKDKEDKEKEKIEFAFSTITNGIIQYYEKLREYYPNFQKNIFLSIHQIYNYYNLPFFIEGITNLITNDLLTFFEDIQRKHNINIEYREKKKEIVIYFNNINKKITMKSNKKRNKFIFNLFYHLNETIEFNYLINMTNKEPEFCANDNFYSFTLKEIEKNLCKIFETNPIEFKVDKRTIFCKYYGEYSMN